MLCVCIIHECVKDHSFPGTYKDNENNTYPYVDTKYCLNFCTRFHKCQNVNTVISFIVSLTTLI